ncbi:hypothetical protein [Candidatus Amarolinea dominans]|nr:hypothetical protein [Anaerolineae bacterium]
MNDVASHIRAPSRRPARADGPGAQAALAWWACRTGERLVRSVLPGTGMG